MAWAGRTYRLISADSHVVEPPYLYEKWVERKYQDQVPQLVKDPKGGDAWLYKGAQAPVPVGLVTVVGPRPEKLDSNLGVRFGHEVHPGCHEGGDRLQLMDADGVDAEVLYPTPSKMWALFTGYEPEVHQAVIRGYNRWMFEQFCAADPTRLIGSYVIPRIGVEAAVSELTKARTIGARHATLNTWPSGKETLSREDDPFWAAAQDLGLPIGIHVKLATQINPHKSPPESRGASGAFIGIVDMGYLLMDLIFSGVFDRFPRLQIVAAETGAGWIPHYLGLLDDRHWRNRTWAGTKLDKLPSEYFKSNWTTTFVSGSDRVGLQIRHAVGLRNMCWSTDFPHPGNDWPFSRKVIQEMFVNIPDDEKRMIVCDNAARLYGLMS